LTLDFLAAVLAAARVLMSPALKMEPFIIWLNCFCDILSQIFITDAQSGLD